MTLNSPSVRIAVEPDRGVVTLTYVNKTDGRTHRTDGPAFTSVAPSGNSIKEWRLNGAPLRNADAPARIAYNADPSLPEVLELSWWDRYIMVRASGPTKVGSDGDIIWYYTDTALDVPNFSLKLQPPAHL